MSSARTLTLFFLPSPQALGDHTFWFTCFLATVILLLPVVAWRFYRMDVQPTLTDRARLRQRTDRKAKPRPEFRPFSGRRSRFVRRSHSQIPVWKDEGTLRHQDFYAMSVTHKLMVVMYHSFTQPEVGIDFGLIGPLFATAPVHKRNCRVLI